MKVLIVEDDVVSRKKLEWLVNGFGYETLLAHSGREGWEIWEYERPRIVITDWIIPDLDGLELCRKIRNHEGSQYTYIIIVTTQNETEDMVRGLDAGADDYITKPVIKEELAVRIRSGERIVEFESRNLVILAISKLAESRDPEMGNHLERIRHYSKIISESLMNRDDAPAEINKLFIENIFLSSPLHDIGKIGIPDYVLLKMDRLDDREFEIMKTHTTIGFTTLNAAAQSDGRAEYLVMSADIALYHHERYDGKGYPSGLQGEKIPLCARIVALADVYDALVSKRVYKTAFPHEVARSIIIGEKGRHFDPMIVDAFLESENRFIEVHHKYNM